MIHPSAQLRDFPVFNFYDFIKLLYFSVGVKMVKYAALQLQDLCPQVKKILCPQVAPPFDEIIF